MLLVGDTGGLRQSEIAALTVADLEWKDEGAVLTLRQSKTDEAGRGRQVAIPRGAHLSTCPATALRTWLEVTGVQEGALFHEVDRHGRVGDRGSTRIRSAP